MDGWIQPSFRKIRTTGSIAEPRTTRTHADVGDGRLGDALYLAGTQLPAGNELLDFAVKLLRDCGRARRWDAKTGTSEVAIHGRNARCRSLARWLTSSEVIGLSFFRVVKREKQSRVKNSDNTQRQ